MLVPREAGLSLPTVTLAVNIWLADVKPMTQVMKDFFKCGEKFGRSGGI
jgi:hypothetical protein